MQVEPRDVFQGTVVVTVPHMDDCVLGCGGMIAKLPCKERIHIIYATDGMKAPTPILPWRDSVSPDLGLIRTREARAAMGSLGIPAKNIHFLNLPEGQLGKHMAELKRLLSRLLVLIEPTQLLVPFRYDRHKDHLALNRVVTTIHQQRGLEAKLTEYFVYYHWRLLPGGDVRTYIRPEQLLEVSMEDVSRQKRAALDYFKSQTTRFYDWQTRPNLTQQLLDQVSQAPEFFLTYDPSLPGPTVFTRHVLWIRLVHRLEPFLKAKKDRAVALTRRGFGRE